MKPSIIAVALALLCAPAAAQEQKLPEAADLLFETPQWEKAAPDTTLTYRYTRKTSNEAILGLSFEDRIRLHLDKGEAAGQRTVRVELFSGERRRSAGPFEDTMANPALVLFLEYHLSELAPRLKANPRYIKNAIRAALREKASVQKAQVALEGRSLPATKVVIRPFVDDPNKERMQGLDTLTYTFTVSDDVPGQIVEIHASARLADGSIGLEESLTYDPKNG